MYSICEHFEETKRASLPLSINHTQSSEELCYDELLNSVQNGPIRVRKDSCFEFHENNFSYSVSTKGQIEFKMFVLKILFIEYLEKCQISASKMRKPKNIGQSF